MLSSPGPLSYNSRIEEKAIHLVSNLQDWQSLWKQSKKILKTRPRKKKPNATTAHSVEEIDILFEKKILGTRILFSALEGKFCIPRLGAAM